MLDANTQALHDHLCKEELAALRDDAVESAADFSMTEGQDFYPFDLDNFSEVLAELNDFQIQTILHYVRDSKAQNFRSEYLNEMLARMMSVFAHDYMRDYAMKKADREVE